MKIVQLFKWERDPEECFVNEDGSVKLRRDRLVASDDDAAAIVSARRVAEETGGELVGATIGNGDASWAAARGAARTVCADGLMPALDDAGTARALAEAVRAAGPADLVVMGDTRDFAGVAGVLAALLELPLVAGVESFQADPDGGIIARRVIGKEAETLRIAPPALVTVAAVEGEKNVPSMKEMLAAKKAPREKIACAEVEASPLVQTGRRRPELHRATIFEGPVSEAVDQLVAALRADEVL